MPYKDPEKQKEVQRQWYLDNKVKVTESTKRNKPEFKRRRGLWLQEIKESLQCANCPENRGPCLTFHHKDPKIKEHNIARMLWYASKERVLAELKKCIVLCQNCHTLYHWEEVHGEYTNGCIA